MVVCVVGWCFLFCFVVFGLFVCLFVVRCCYLLFCFVSLLLLMCVCVGGWVRACVCVRGGGGGGRGGQAMRPLRGSTVFANLSFRHHLNSPLKNPPLSTKLLIFCPRPSWSIIMSQCEYIICVRAWVGA